MKDGKLKFVLYDEASMIGRDLLKRSEKDAEQLWEQTKHLVDCTSWQLRTSTRCHQEGRDSYIFKDDPQNYGPLAISLWQTYFHIYSLTQIMRQQEYRQFCEILNTLQVGKLTVEDEVILNT